MRLLSPSRHAPDERLLWSRDIRFVHRLAEAIPFGRVLDLDAGTVLIAPAGVLTDALAARIAEAVHSPGYGLVMIDPSLPAGDRYLFAMGAAVQSSGLADRIGMAQTTHVVQTKMLDYFFSLRRLHGVAFQPIVDLSTGLLHEYECLFRPDMPMLPQSITSVVQAAVSTDRTVELDTFIIAAILEKAGRLDGIGRAAGHGPLRIAINMTPASLLESSFEAAVLAETARAAGLQPSQITVECTEQQAVADMVQLKRKVKALRRLGFGFAIDDAGAGYASFALIAALRPSVIKIDRDIVHGMARDEAKRALVEAFVSFGRRIGAKLLAEGIERRADLAAVTELGVDYGQGYLLGRPKSEPEPPRSLRIHRKIVPQPGSPAPRSLRLSPQARGRSD